MLITPKKVIKTTVKDNFASSINYISRFPFLCKYYLKGFLSTKFLVNLIFTKESIFWLRFRLHYTKKSHLYLLQTKFIREVKKYKEKFIACFSLKQHKTSKFTKYYLICYVENETFVACLNQLYRNIFIDHIYTYIHHDWFQSKLK